MSVLRTSTMQSLLAFLLVLAATNTTPVARACGVGAFQLETCGSVNETTVLKAWLDRWCYFYVNVIWGDVSEGYFVNATDYDDELPEEEESGSAVALREGSMEHTYSVPGDYTIQVNVQGYLGSHNITSFNDLVDEHINIKLERDVTELAIREDSCQDTSAALTTSFHILLGLVTSLSVVWLW